MADNVLHAFISAKASSPDPTLVSSNQWNDGHIFSGGITRQVLVYDSTQPNNMRWSDGIGVYASGYFTNVSTPTPITNMGALVLTFNSSGAVYISFNVYSYTSVGAAAGDLSLYFDGALISTFGVTSGSFKSHSFAFGNVAAGNHTLSATFTTLGGVNVTLLGYNISVLTAGT